jgi:hypothetical protein
LRSVESGTVREDEENFALLLGQSQAFEEGTNSVVPFLVGRLAVRTDVEVFAVLSGPSQAFAEGTDSVVNPRQLFFRQDNHLLSLSLPEISGVLALKELLILYSLSYCLSRIYTE